MISNILNICEGKITFVYNIDCDYIHNRIAIYQKLNLVVFFNFSELVEIVENL